MTSRKPLDPDLYADVVAEAKSRFDVWPSAYASGWVVKTYKARGGRYAGATKDQRTGLTKWFGEEWVDLSRPIHDEDGELVGYEPCGRKTAQDASNDPAAYPKCRPLKEAMRMSPSEVKDAIKRKRAAEAKAGRGGRGGRGARAPVRVATYRANPDVTSTQAFRRWFGDSKVVDAAGEPLVVYHGTNKSFDVFNTRSKSVNSTTFGDVETKRSGIFVSDNPEFAREFGSRLLPLYARIENLAEVNRDTALDFAETIDAFAERDLWLLAKNISRSWMLFDGELGPRFIAYLQELGYDGATFIEDVPKGDDVGEDEQEYVEGRTYVAFYPEQIKLADGTNTTFDPANPDVRFNPHGGSVANIIAAKDYYGDAGVRPLQHMLKAGGEQGEEAARLMALDMAPFLPEDALLVPMPSRHGHGGAGLQLAEALSSLTGHPVVDVLRGRKRPSLYTLKKRGTDPSSVDLGLYLADELPAGTPVIVDNVVGTGHTARSALQAVPGAIVLVHALDSKTFAGLAHKKTRANPYDSEDDPLSDVHVIATDELEDGTVVKYVASPFPYERKPLGHRDDPKVQGLVNLANLIGTQRRVSVAGVEKYLAGADEKPPRPGSSRMPAILVYETSDGRQYIADGHHRAFAALLRDMETFPAIIQFVRE